MTSDKSQEIAHLVERVAKADQEFGSDLLTTAEKLLLQKLTRGRGSQLDSILGLMQNIKGKSESSQISGENMSDRGTYLARGFSAAVEMLEGMDSQGLSDMIALLRDTGGPEPIDADADLPVANVVSVEPLPHVVSCLKAARLKSMQKALYNKFGPGAHQKLYNAGEIYGKRIALDFKNKNPGLEKTIREIERVTKLAGWGEISFHRVDARRIECTIKNTVFNYTMDEAKNSCYFASGIAGGIISALLPKVGHFVASESECVSDGCGHCKFETIAE